MCAAKDLEMHSPMASRVEMDGVGDEYEWPKKWQGQWMVQL